MVEIRLTADADVDVQLFDTDDKSKFPEGKAIVAWCEDAKTCNIGTLGSEEGLNTKEYKCVAVQVW